MYSEFWLETKGFKKAWFGFAPWWPMLVVFPWVQLFGWSANNLQQEKEDLDDVEVDRERGEHVFLWTDGVLPVSYQELGVVR